MKFLVMGSMNYDHIYRMKQIVSPGETASSMSLETVCGGKGLNQAVALAKAGASVFQAGMLGADGEEIRRSLLHYGVDGSRLGAVPERCGHAVIQVDESGQNAIVLYGGSNQCFTRAYMEEAMEGFSKGDWIVLQNEINGTKEAIRLAGERGLGIALNPSPFTAGILDWPLEQVSLLFLNEVEGGQLTGEKEETAMEEALADRFPEAEIVLTLGEKGAVWRKGKERLYQPAFLGPVVDTTAAGDTFTGFFLGARARGKTVAECLQTAARAAALTVGRPGAAPSIPTWEEVYQSGGLG